MKLGCTFYECKKGNNKRWEKNNQIVPLPITDIRDESVINTNTPLLEHTEGKFFYVLTSCEQGVCLGIAKHTPGDRDDDHKIVWVQIHRTIMQDEELADNLLKLIDCATEIINTLGTERDYSQIDSLLNKEYTEHIPCPISVGTADTFAVKSFDSIQPDSLTNILQHLYQPSWFKKYRAIMLIDKSEGINPSKNCIELSDDSIEKFTIITERKIKEVNNINSKDIKILDKDNKQLADFWLSHKSKEEIHFQKEHFDIVSKWILSDCKFNSALTFFKKIGPGDFKVVDNENGETLNGFEIKYKNESINSHGKDINEKDFNENKNYSILITKEGYDDVKIQLKDILEIEKDKPYDVGMERSTKTYIYNIEDSGSDPIELTFKTKNNINIENFSPLTGYVVVNSNSNKPQNPKNLKLKYDNWNFINEWRFWLTAASIAIVFGLLGCLFKQCSADAPQIENTPQKESDIVTDPSCSSPVNPPQNAPLHTPIQDACNYLDSHPQWKKEEMEKIYELKGLWDALNAYDSDKIKGYNPSLFASKKFAEIVNAIPAAGKSGTFCGDSDKSYTITVDRYISKLKETPQIQTPANNSVAIPTQKITQTVTQSANQTQQTNNQEKNSGANNKRH